MQITWRIQNQDEVEIHCYFREVHQDLFIRSNIYLSIVILTMLGKGRKVSFSVTTFPELSIQTAKWTLRKVFNQVGLNWSQQNSLLKKRVKEGIEIQGPKYVIFSNFHLFSQTGLTKQLFISLLFFKDTQFQMPACTLIFWKNFTCDNLVFPWSLSGFGREGESKL